eukprot:TRINITY_DN274_c0_g1_i1.p1 TRINITY_DN274_c0_g1~~TRINITY_DN274_c0_g1_i1.p1  ORF type:complete len:646 (+),score=233.36 TRINITY_DN274_c0_g1_i1:55-1992(+)
MDEGASLRRRVLDRSCGDANTAAKEKKSAASSDPHGSVQELVDAASEQELSAWPYASAFIFPLALLLGVYGGGVLTYLGVVMAYVVMPLVELLAPIDTYNPTREQCKRLEHQLAFRLLTWLYAPVPAIMVVWCAYLVSTSDYSWFELVGIVCSSALVTGGIGITVAHELMHKQNSFEQYLSMFILIFTGYMHFFIEHLHGHHKRVATEEDPATSRYGESLYAFVPRSVYGSFLSAWHLETARIERTYGEGHVWSWRNQMLWFVATPAAVAASLWWAFGSSAVWYFAVQAVVGFSLLEVVNYIEHYGLVRSEADGGRYERVSPLHSWNADHVVSNYLMFKLQRHADHHTWPTRRYQTLRTWEFSPKMPTGYAGMMLLATVPPLWRYFVDPMVHKYNRVHARRIAQLDSYVLEPRAGHDARAVEAVEAAGAESSGAAARSGLALPGAADVNQLLHSTSTLIAAYSPAPAEYIDPFIAKIPPALRDAYSQFSPSSAFAAAHYFPSLSLEWLYALLSERQARAARRFLSYVEVRTAQLLIMLGSALAWVGLQLGGRGGALLLVRSGMHVCHLAESMLFGEKPAHAKCDGTAPADEWEEWDGAAEAAPSSAALPEHLRRVRSSPCFASPHGRPSRSHSPPRDWAATAVAH